MKSIAIALALILLSALVWYSIERPVPPPSPPVPPDDSSVELSSTDRDRAEVPVFLSQPQPEGTERLVARLNEVLSKLENLEVSLHETQTQITLRSENRQRTEVTAYPSNATSRLGDQDLENLRTLIREELKLEAWKQRQVEIVDIARNLSFQLPIEAKTIDPLIEVLCTNGRTMFDLERDLSDQNHDRTMAKRRAPDFRLARRRLRDDIGSVYRDDELAARVFLHVVSHGEVPSIRMDRERLLATEKEWLR